jgi:pyridinium-3,5-biscarboxylic acid mononucleotide sulfurtransferase
MTKLDGLRTILHGVGRAAVAYSGGVDSTFLLKIAQEELGNAVLAVIVESEVMPSSMVVEAVDNAREMGVDIAVLSMDILTLPGFAGNAKDRCYICKKAIFEEIISLARARGIETVVDGSHSGDQDDDRPGRRALKELGVRSPLTEAGFEKDDVRYFSELMFLRTARKPASPCLATRIPFDHPITAEKLQQVEEAERTIADLGIEVLRVRHHGTIARIEVLPADMPMILSARDVIVQKLRELGFTYVDLDLQGYRTGSMREPLGRKN